MFSSNTCYIFSTKTQQMRCPNDWKRTPKRERSFFTCSLIDYIARKTKNPRAIIVNALGKERLQKIYDLADIYHSDNIARKLTITTAASIMMRQEIY